MRGSLRTEDRPLTWRYGFWLLWMACLIPVAGAFVRPAGVRAQEPGGPAASAPDAEVDGNVEGGLPDTAAQTVQLEPIRVWTLLRRGGFFLIPIALMSLLVGTIAIERALALRRGRLLPPQLIQRLGDLGGSGSEFDPRDAYRLCQQFPSTASTVLRAMLLKIGRPHSEVEHAVAEASQREAERLFGNVRWLNLAAAVTPLMGLLGTVWGMIRAFHLTSQMSPGQNKAEFLAEGIYVALVTTLCGLIVAIPAAILAHFFEGRLQKMFHQVDELMFNLMPQIERFEGRVRFGRAQDGASGEEPVTDRAGTAVP